MPEALVEAVRYFADTDRRFKFVKILRWDGGVVTCPRSGETGTPFLTTRRIWKRLRCKLQFPINVGTIMKDSGLGTRDSGLGFDKLLPAIWPFANSKNGISSHELGRTLGITERSAWFLIHRIRVTMVSGKFQKLSGTVATDETYIGGLSRNMRVVDRKHKIHGTGEDEKIAVYCALERVGPIVATMVDHPGDHSPDQRPRSGRVRLDGLHRSVIQLRRAPWEFDHKSVNHGTGEYVRGVVHTNVVENFWVHYKRAWSGTYTHNAGKNANR